VAAEACLEYGKGERLSFGAVQPERSRFRGERALR
jgi:hypothetical protein